jgi:membrane dipeptidase
MTAKKEQMMPMVDGGRMSNRCSRRELLAAGAAAAAFAALPAALRAATAENTWRPYRSAVVIDACGGPGSDDTGPGGAPLAAADLAAIRDSGVTALNYTLGGSVVGRFANAFESTARDVAFWDHEIAAHPDVLIKITRGAQLDDAKRTSRLGIIYGFQDTTMYGENLERFDVFHEFGVRIVQPTYNRRNLMGDGCLEPGNAGLSRLGRDLVAKLNERGVLLDLSHCGQRTTREGIEASSRPVAVTHSGCAAVNDNPRNKRDEELKLLADRGGVVGIYVMPYLRASGQVMAEDVVRHVEYAVKVCGEDHVGIGTDGAISAIDITPEFRKQFAEITADRQKRGIAAPGERPDSFTFAPDLNTPHRFERLAVLLSQRGHSDARIAKILGGNFARLFREVIV